MGVAISRMSAQCTAISYTCSSWSVLSIEVIEHGQVQALAALE